MNGQRKTIAARIALVALVTTALAFAAEPHGGRDPRRVRAASLTRAA